MLQHIGRFIVASLFFYSCLSLATVPITVTLQSAPPSTLPINSTATANYVVALHPAVPGPLSLSLQSGVPAGVSQKTSGASPCGSLALCGSSFTLNPGNSCCLAFTLNASQMGLGQYYLAPLVSTTPGTYRGQAAPYIITVESASSESFTIVSSTDGNGTISPSGSVNVASGGSQTFTATPNTNYQVNQWLLDGIAVQTGGTTYTLNNVTAPHTVEVTFSSTQTSFLITPQAGTGGMIDPSQPFTVAAGASQLFKGIAGASQTVDQWLLDGVVVQTGGATYTLSNITASHTVAVTFRSSLTTLQATPSTLTLSVTGITPAPGGSSISGTPRVFTVTNTGSNPAIGVACPTPNSPSISSISCVGCGTIAIGGSCTVTITPSSTPSAAVGDTNPTPVLLSIHGTNTPILNPIVNVLTYGSFYQGGYIFSIFETLNTSASITGTVAAETDVVVPSTGVTYSPGGAATNSLMYSGTDGTNTVGGNTNGMVSTYGTNPNYSAGYCIPNNYSSGGYSDWYLPAICEMGVGADEIGTFDCSSSSAPDYIPNIQTNLLEANPSETFNFVNNSAYWSSTASAAGAPTLSWVQRIVFGASGAQFTFSVSSVVGVRCVRTTT